MSGHHTHFEHSTGRRARREFNAEKTGEEKRCAAKKVEGYPLGGSALLLILVVVDVALKLCKALLWMVGVWKPRGEGHATRRDPNREPTLSDSVAGSEDMAACLFHSRRRNGRRVRRRLLLVWMERQICRADRCSRRIRRCQW